MMTGAAIECVWESLGGGERAENGIVSVTAKARMTARKIPAFRSDCRIRCADGSVWEIVGQPSDTGLSDRWAVLMLQRITGGA